jgi:cytochrome c553
MLIVSVWWFATHGYIQVLYTKMPLIRRSLNKAAIFLLVFMCLALDPAQILKAEVASNSVSPTLLVLPDLLPTANIIWDAEFQTTNVVARLDYAEFVFSFTNISSKTITIIDVHTSCGCTTVQLPPLPWTVPPGTNGKIGVHVNLAGKGGTLIKTITVGTDQGTKTLLVKIIMPPPSTPVMTETNRTQNLLVSQKDRQAVFSGDCARCHVKPTEGKYGQQLYDPMCGICHEAAHRATMVPDLHTLTVATDEVFWRSWISYGRPGSLMPGFAKTENGPLSDMQIASLAAYLKMTIPSHITNSLP